MPAVARDPIFSSIYILNAYCESLNTNEGFRKETQIFLTVLIAFETIRLLHFLIKIKYFSFWQGLKRHNILVKQN